jgi:RNA polymerase sigma factor (sigma-70 family)
MEQGVRTALAERHDDELVALARGGDEQAFAALYQRYFRGLYDFSLRMVRDREAASDVVQTTFVKAWAAVQAPKGVENVKAWLYAVARNLAIDEIRRRQRIASPRSDEDEDPIYTIVDESRLADPSVAVHDQELVELVWESASALTESEYSLLDMHLRQGLDADELSEALGVAKGAVYTRLTRLRDSLDEAVTSAVLMKHARQQCEELDALLTRMNAVELTREVKKAINEHVKMCDICGETKRRLISPAELFAGIALIPVTPGLQDAIWNGIASQLGFAGATAAGHAAAGHSTASHGGHGHGMSAATKAKAITLLGTLAAVAVVGALLYPRAAKPKDPTDVHATNVTVGARTPIPFVHVAWTPTKGAEGYSVSWTNAPRSEPDAVRDLPGTANGVSSPALAPGSWWFHLRTNDHGRWTDTVHLGPFVVTGSTAAMAPLIPANAFSPASLAAKQRLAARLRAQRLRAQRLRDSAQAVVGSSLGAGGGLGAAGGSGAGGGGGSSAGGVAGAEHTNTPGDGGTPAPGAPGGSGGTTPTTTTPTTTTPAPPNSGPTPPGTEPGTTTTPGNTTTTGGTTTTPRTTTTPVNKPTPPDPSIPPDEIGFEGTFTTTVP